MSASWIHKLNESDSRLFKEDVISQALVAAKLGSDHAKRFLKLVNVALDPMVTFGVQKVPETAGIIDAENPWSEFEDMLSNLQRRNLTGHDARDTIAEISTRFDSDEWNTMCRAVLKKDLRCGVSEKTVNKICKKTEYEVKVFGCQLATSSDGRPEMKGIKRLEPKLDGVRVLMVITKQQNGKPFATCYSRNGKVFENFGHIESQILDNFKLTQSRQLADGVVLDGEIIGNTFQELMRQARRKTDAAAEDSVFNVFDIIPLADFRRGHWNSPLSKRISWLEQMRWFFDEMPNVELLPHIMVD